jgi:nicotinamidase/pyrazinamidase
MLSERDALLVVDMQRDFLPGGALAVAGGDEIVPVLAACIESFERSHLPIAASRDWHPSDHCSFRESGGPWPPHCVAGTAGAELDPGLHLPADARIVDKARCADQDAYSAFQGTDLDAWLRARGVHRLFIGGLATDYCVQQSARDALRCGYEVVLLEDGIRAIDPVAGKRITEELCDLDATVIRSGEILDE